MTPFHDFICNLCSEFYLDMPITADGAKCLNCRNGTLEISWSAPPRNANVHHSERAVVYVSDKEGKTQFPGRADLPVPKRLVDRGYRKVELNSIHDIARLERREHVASHILNYDRSGHSYDGSDS